MDLLKSITHHSRTLGILIDPEKLVGVDMSAFAKAIQSSITKLTTRLQLDQVLLLVGGSTMKNIDMDQWMLQFKELYKQPVIIFPGSADQLTENADGLLFLNLVSGRNPEYLIGQQVRAAGRLKGTKLQVIPTAYLLINGGIETAVQRVSATTPMDQNRVDIIVDTAYAGMLMGNQLIYLEAGSGASRPVECSIVKQVAHQCHVPIIVGGGLKKLGQIEDRFNAGAAMVVVGTAIEKNLQWIG